LHFAESFVQISKMEVEIVDDDEYAAIMMALDQAAAQKASQGAVNQGQPRQNQMAGAHQAGGMHAAQQQRPINQQHVSQQHTQPQSHRPANLQERNSGNLSQQQNRPSHQAGQPSIGNYFMNKGTGSTTPSMTQGTSQPAQVIDV
jgi:hypothetical protein